MTAITVRDKIMKFNTSAITFFVSFLTSLAFASDKNCDMSLSNAWNYSAKRLFASSCLSYSLLVMVLVAFTIAPAGAVINIEVTTTDDVTNLGDTVVSLREAIDMANSNTDDTIIQLENNQTYQLTDCISEGGSGNDDANLDGDLDHTAADDLTIKGNDSTIENTCQNNRVLHHHHEDSMLVLEDLTVTGGINPHSGTNIKVLGFLTMTRVVVTNGVGSSSRSRSSVVVGHINSSVEDLQLKLMMTNSSVRRNQSGGVQVIHGNANVSASRISDNDGAGFGIKVGTLRMDSTRLVRNNGNGVGGTDGSIYITNSVAEYNNGFGFKNTGYAGSGQPLNLTDVTVTNNAKGGVQCSGCTELTLLNSTVSSNNGTGVGMFANVIGPTMTITNSLILDNIASGRPGADEPDESGGVEMIAVGDAIPLVTITRSTIARNTSGPDARGGGILVTNAGLDINHSTITNNEALGEGGGIASVGDQPVTLNFVTLVENTTAAGAANIQRDTGALNLTASVVALPIGGDNCDGAGDFSSGGFNQIDDSTCGFGGGTGDVVPADDPLLERLASSRGSLPVRVPFHSSPLRNAVTGVVCDTAGIDQRSISRPMGTACDVGAVEATANEILFIREGVISPKDLQRLRNEGNPIFPNFERNHSLGESLRTWR